MEWSVKPQILDKEKLLLVGLGLELADRSVPPVERFRAIPELWRTLFGELAQLGRPLQRADDRRYTVIDNDVRDNGAAPLYWALIAVTSFSDVPASLERVTVEGGRFAVFVHQGMARDLAKTVAEIHTVWAPQISGLFASDREIFVYPPGYDPISERAKLEYWLPLGS